MNKDSWNKHIQYYRAKHLCNQIIKIKVCPLQQIYAQFDLDLQINVLLIKFLHSTRNILLTSENRG